MNFEVTERADRHLQHRRRLLLGRHLRGHHRPRPAQLPGPRLGGLHPASGPVPLTQQGSSASPIPGSSICPLAGGFDLFSLQRDYTEYTYDTLGAPPHEQSLRGVLAVDLGYRLSQDDISDISAVATPDLRTGGDHDHLDDLGGPGARQPRQRRRRPPRAGRFSINGDFAGLGGDNQFVKTVGLPLVLPAHLVRPHPAGRDRGRLSVPAGGARSPALRALLPGRPEHAPRLQVPAALAGRRQRPPGPAATPRSSATSSTSSRCPSISGSRPSSTSGNVYGFSHPVRHHESRKARGQASAGSPRSGPSAWTTGLKSPARAARTSGRSSSRWAHRSRWRG